MYGLTSDVATHVDFGGAEVQTEKEKQTHIYTNQRSYAFILKSHLHTAQHD